MSDQDLDQYVAAAVGQIFGSAGEGCAIVAFSAGVDSTVALQLAIEALGTDRVIAATGVSPSLPADERDEAGRIARSLGVRWIEVETDEIHKPEYIRNDGRRCYACKSTLYDRLHELARSVGGTCVINGVIAGDDDGTRPGVSAGRERGVVMPLIDNGIDKPLVRAIARRFGLPNREKPASPCLASRLPFGTPVTIGALSQIEQAERVLHGLGFIECRVRHHGKVARIEVPSSDLPRLLAEPVRSQVIDGLKLAGYVYVSVDLQGLRSGSAHEAEHPR